MDIFKKNSLELILRFGDSDTNITYPYPCNIVHFYRWQLYFWSIVIACQFLPRILIFAKLIFVYFCFLAEEWKSEDGSGWSKTQRMTAILILFRIKSASRKDLPKTWKFIIKCQNVLQYFAEINRLRTWSFCYTALVSCQNFFIDISIKINQFCWFSLSKKHIYI